MFQHDAGRSALQGGHNYDFDATDCVGSFRHWQAMSESKAVEYKSTAEYYRRLEHLAQRFDNDVDRQIGVALSDGVHVRRIKADLRVGQHRIERVAKQLRIWMREEPEESDGTE